MIGVIQMTHTTSTSLKSLEQEINLIPSAEGLAVFIGDQMIDFLGGEDARSYNLITGKLESAVIVTPSEGEKGVNAVEIVSSASKLDIKRVDQEYVGMIEIEIDGNLTEATGMTDISNPKSIHAIEEATSQAIMGEIASTLQKVQTMKSDIFGFGQALHRKYPKEWKSIKENWNQIFGSMTIEVTVKTQIQRTGVSNEQLNVRE